MRAARRRRTDALRQAPAIVVVHHHPEASYVNEGRAARGEQ
ncbi:hypothetical protein OG372_35815 [Streptomyces sp. NBC_01020]|nr:hypothetical protein OG372_35815 [Streptomyces sp. NBC_01020]WSX65320.1 hypothetical protein OG221_01215 [Streptomyces sp. NBC_00932]